MKPFTTSRAALCRLVCLLALGLVTLTLRAADSPTPDARLLGALKLRAIGPANMSGRITDIAVVEQRPTTMYVASASGGLWKTINNGTTWQCVFEKEATISLGAVAVCPSRPEIVWVGTGEANPRNSVSWGDGVYKSTDGGKTWRHMGLKETRHIGRIVIHPTRPDIVYVAALGHVWGPNVKRGLYRTVDGGASWDKVKFIDPETGFIDVAMDPADPDTLYAAAWQQRRDAFAGGNPAVLHGPGSGLYRSTDGGRMWQRMTQGLPDRPLGRCGLSVCRKDTRVIYAVVAAKETSTTTQGQPANEKTVLEKGGVFRSDDKGRTWRHVNSLCPRQFYYGQIRADPNDPERVYVLGVITQVSEDGGKTFAKGNLGKGIHVDYHALWIDPRDSDHLILGCDGGLNFSNDRGASWERLMNLPVSQFYAVAVDMRRPFRVYGGLQDNGSWGAPSATHDPAGITFADWTSILGGDGFYCQVDPGDANTVYAEIQYGGLRRINVATGAVTDIKPRLAGEEKKKKREDVEVPGGEAKKTGKKKGKGAKGPPLPTNFQPPLPKGTPAFRFNWSSPVLLSPHNRFTLYYGGNHLFRSVDRGDHWQVISPDLTRGKPGPDPTTGHTITTVAESPLKVGLIYVGTDDGRLHITRDGGNTWMDLSERIPGVPAERWITRVECSPFAEGTAYVSIDRHRNDDFAPYLFKTSDYGQTWQSLRGNLPPEGPVHVVRADPRNKDLLYVGTEFGLFISLDGGGTWQRQRNGLPTVAVHDLVVHPRDRELVAATHGRGIYLMDVAPLQELTPKVLTAEVHLFEIKPALAYRPHGPRSWAGTKMYLGTNPPYGAEVYYYLREPVGEAPKLTITDGRGKPVAELKTAKGAGLHRVSWELRTGGAKAPPAAMRPVPPGEYTATLRVGEREWRKPIRVEAE
jgi:photosystem II stability/assembly factor-like uncharacterized protein